MGVCSLSELVYAIEPGYERFVTHVGVHQHGERSQRGSISARVAIDGKTVAESKVLRYNDPRFNVDVAIPTGSRKISLTITDGGDDRGWDQAAWAAVG